MMLPGWRIDNTATFDVWDAWFHLCLQSGAENCSLISEKLVASKASLNVYNSRW